MTIIRTVLGDIAPEQLGPTLAHEHMVSGWHGWEFDPKVEFNWEGAVGKVVGDLLKAKQDYGITGYVDATMPDLGRDLPFEVACARGAGVHIIGATGFYKDGRGIPYYWRQLDIDAIEEYLAHDITEGVGGVRCGIIKLATNGATITEAEAKVLRAGARASRRLGVALLVHTDPEGWATTNVGQLQLDILRSEGADPTRVIISHACGTGNLAYLLELARQGVYLSFDRCGATPILPDEVRAATVAGLVVAGYGGQILLGHDWTGIWKRRPEPVEGRRPPQVGSALGSRDWGHVHREILPRLRQGGISERAIEAMLVDNPRQALAF